MSIERIIASIPNRTALERKTMRAHALAKLDSANPEQIAEAQKLLAALDDHEQHLTEADMATIKALAGKPLSERVKAAFEIDPPSPTEQRLIQVLLANPGGNCAELSTKIGWAPNTWDLGFGAICAQRAAYLNELSGTPSAGKSANLPLLTLQDRGEDGIIRYTMKPEAVAAFRHLGFQVKPE
ncbi:hypothetical protein [Sandarakinorhabdus rubra]|uniref:hypothetical protein n=1 Tax=Sandarakinorhabdus rubra TaxID=2672568 RepID=UPI0013DCA583|nr:hypothetical protein [Sandarakinorhabdus rubra]